MLHEGKHFDWKMNPSVRTAFENSSANLHINIRTAKDFSYFLQEVLANTILHDEVADAVGVSFGTEGA